MNLKEICYYGVEWNSSGLERVQLQASVNMVVNLQVP